jgi:DNA-binding beta-propeller fold protein YncE
MPEANRVKNRLFLLVLALALSSITAPLIAAAASPEAHACATSVPRYDVAVPGHPFGSVQSIDGSTLFVGIVGTKPDRPNGIAVLRCTGGRYRFTHLSTLEPQPAGMVGTHDGKLLIVADDAFVAFIDQQRALDGEPALIGYFQDVEGDPEDNDAGSVHVNVSPDDRYVFVADESNRTITVIDLAKARSTGFSRAAIVGQIPVADAPIAVVFSPDAKYLFSTSEMALKSDRFAAACRHEGAGAGAAIALPPGVIFAIDVARAETDPAQAVVGRIPGACSPVRMAIAPDGRTVYVTNRNSNSVTAYSTAVLVAGRANALTSTVPVGPGPVAIAATADGRYVLAASANRFAPSGPPNGTISVISTKTMTVVGTIPTGVFPREFSSGAGSMLFLANNRSDTITVFDTSRMPELLAPR